jgi:sugar phosphate permease
VHNFLGPSITLAIGGIGYGLYAGSLLATNVNGPSLGGFVIGAGAILGICAGMLWTAQGCVMMSYPKEKDKGKFIAIFWIIFNLGAVMGGALLFGINFNNDTGSVSNSTYVAFIVLMGMGAALGLLLANPHDVFHPDDTPVVFQRSNKVSYEVMNLMKVFTDWRMLLLAPAIFSSNYFYTYQ